MIPAFLKRLSERSRKDLPLRPLQFQDKMLRLFLTFLVVREGGGGMFCGGGEGELFLSVEGLLSIN